MTYLNNTQTENLETLTDKIKRVSDIYAKTYNIKRDEDWYFLKLLGEIGELTKEYNIIKRRTIRPLNLEAIEDEIADCFCHIILLADCLDINIEKTIKRKWFKFLK